MYLKVGSILLAIFTLACNTASKQNEKTLGQEEGVKEEVSTLKQILDEKKNKFAAKADEEKKRVYAAGIDSVRKSGILKNALNIGDPAPDFVLKNALGKDIQLSKALKQGPVVLTWYRGGWCPYCNITLRHLQQKMPEFRGRNTQVFALTPELPDRSMSTQEKNELEFEVLSDLGSKVGQRYGVIYELTSEVAKRYQASFGLHEYNGDSANTLPLAATYVIDQLGIIQWSFLDADYRNRAEPADVIKALDALK